MTIKAEPTTGGELTSRERLISLAELVVGACIVIGHNVFHVVSNEVPILFALFWISGFLRGKRWIRDGFTAPASWGRTILYAFVAAAVLQVGSEFLVEPLAHHFFREPETTSSLLRSAPHNWAFLFRTLAIVWIFAALGEEVSYRGYLVTRAADLGQRSRLADVIAVLAVAVFFGFGHYYKGPAGVMDSTYSGIVLGFVYLLSGRNLWAAILAHGISDTFAVVLVFLGYAN